MSANEHPENEFHEVPPAASRGFLPILWQRKALVVLGLVLGLAGGFLFYWQREPVYQASALVLVRKLNSQPLQAAGPDMRLSYFEDYMATHVVVIRSPLIVDRAIKKKDLASMKSFEASGDPLGQILSSLAVNRDTKETTGGANNVVYLSFRGPIADECGKVLTAVIDSYQEYLDKQYRNAGDDTVDLITKARDFLKNELAKSEEAFRLFRQKTPIYGRSKEGGNVILERIGSVEAKRSALIIRRIDLLERLKLLEKAIQDGKSTAAIVAMTRGMGETKAATAEKSLEDQLLPLRLQERELLQSYSDDHPQVKSVRGRMELVKEHHAKTSIVGSADSKDPVQQYLTVLREEMRDTDTLEKSLSNLLEGLKLEARDLSNYDMEEDNLRNDMARKQQFYDATIKRLTEINLVRDTQGFNISVLSQSGVGVKVAPSAFQTIVGGAMLGLLLGIGLAFLADLTDKGFRSPEEVRRRLQLPLLGHVPYLKPDPEVTRKVESGEIQVDPLLFTLHKTKSLEAEAYRAIRTALLFSIQGEGHRVIQVTSPSKGDGKSLMVANLAVSIAQSNKRVLIIDADCRRPRQHKVFNLPNKRGLVDIIRQDAGLVDCVQKSVADGVWVVPSGVIPQNPAELLTAPQFRQFLDQARQEFDLVLVDTPPVLAVTDPCIVAGHTDGVVLVLRLTRQGRPNAERAREILKTLKVNMLGLVVNGVTRQGGASIYSTEQYDYSDSYTETDNTGEKDEYDYYEEDETNAAAPPRKPAQTTSSSGGLWSRIFSRKS